VMDSNRTITLKFALPELILVTGGGNALQQAIDSSRSGDTIVVEPGTYYGNIDLGGRRDLVLASINPDDQSIVGDTIIDCQLSGRAFTFDNGEDAGTVVHGFKIINGLVSTGPGGAIYIGAGSSPTITRLIIANCSAAEGGAIYIAAGSSMDLINITISNCTASGDGGAVYVGDGSDILFAACKITTCSALLGSGGALYGGDETILAFEQCEFTGNSANTSGGALCYSAGSLTSLYACALKNNAAHSGGAVYSGGGSFSMIEHCEFSGNSATYSGGAIYYDTASLSQLADTMFTNNAAAEDGGGILCGQEVSVSVADCNFVENSASCGGALYFDPNCSGDVNDSVLVNNTAGMEGGAVYMVGAGEITIADSNLSDNTAHHGGALYCVYSPAATITNCIVQRNEASGTIKTYEYFEPDPDDPNQPLDPENPLDQTDPNFDPNDPNLVRLEHEAPTAIAQGGGIYSWAGPKLVARCDFSNNNAKSSGGAIYLAGDDDPEFAVPQVIRDCLITNNKAGRDGAGISCNWYADVNVAGCTIADNKVGRIPSYGGGLYCAYGSNAEVIDCIFWGNVGNVGSQIAVATGDPGHPIASNLKVSYSNIQVFQQEPNDANEAVQLKVIDPSLLGPDTPDYFIYSVLNVGDHVNDVAFGVFGAGSWVDSDGVNRIIAVSGTTAYIFTVSIPDDSDPQDHAENPYSPGEIAERTFELERIFELGEEYYFGHACEFHVDPEENAVYIGAYVN
ncbi:MAG: right-handed parallel beta-helix repeat-containing protein, partial [Planctomycetota bacterium]